MSYISHLDHLQNQCSGSSWVFSWPWGSLPDTVLCMQEDAMRRHSMLAVVLMLSSSGVAIPSPKPPHTIFEEEEDDKEQPDSIPPVGLHADNTKIQSSKFKLLFQSLHSILVSFSELPYTPKTKFLSSQQFQARTIKLLGFFSSKLRMFQNQLKLMSLGERGRQSENMTIQGG